MLLAVIVAHLNDVQYAPVNADGTVGAWAFTTSFTNARRQAGAVAYRNYMYLIGGYNNTTYYNDVQYTPINADGTLGTWVTTSSFTTGRYGHSAVQYDGYLYVLGGYSGLYLGDVQYSPINTNGTLGAWNATSSLSTPHFAHTSVAFDGYLYAIGGVEHRVPISMMCSLPP